MTNRDKITNKKLARIIIAGTTKPCNYCILKNGCYSGTGNCIQNIENWLSQEAELTADKMFEELGYEKKFSDKNGDNYYHKEINRGVIKSEHIIHILANESSILYGKYEKLDGREFFADILEAEDKAIHKKIEELKSNNTNDICRRNGYYCWVKNWVIYTDDPQFEGKRNYFRKYLTQGVTFTDEITNAKKYDSYSEVSKDMNIIKNKYGIECFDKIIAVRKYQNE